MLYHKLWKNICYVINYTLDCMLYYKLYMTLYKYELHMYFSLLLLNTDRSFYSILLLFHGHNVFSVFFEAFFSCRVCFFKFFWGGRVLPPLLHWRCFPQMFCQCWAVHFRVRCYKADWNSLWWVLLSVSCKTIVWLGLSRYVSLETPHASIF